MKKIIILAAIAFFGLHGFSQKKNLRKKLANKTETIKINNTSKIEIAVIIGYDIAKPFKNADANNNLNGNFYVGYFINPKYEVGIRGSKTFNNASPSMGFGIFARRYFDNLYAGLGVNNALFTFYNQDFFGNNYRTYRNITSINFETGYRFKL